MRVDQFTHLLQTHTHAYMQDMFQIIKSMKTEL